MVAIQFALGAAVLCWEFGWAIDACFNSLVGIRAFQAIELTNIYDAACEIVFFMFTIYLFNFSSARETNL